MADHRRIVGERLNGKEATPRFEEVEQGSSEWNFVASQLLGDSLPTEARTTDVTMWPSMAALIKLDRVVSPKLWAGYVHVSATINGGNANERWLWHGSGKPNKLPSRLLVAGIDPRLANPACSYG